jgi:hypothetical protein
VHRANGVSQHLNSCADETTRANNTTRVVRFRLLGDKLAVEGILDELGSVQALVSCCVPRLDLVAHSVVIGAPTTKNAALLELTGLAEDVVIELGQKAEPPSDKDGLLLTADHILSTGTAFGAGHLRTSMSYG